MTLNKWKETLGMLILTMRYLFFRSTHLCRLGTVDCGRRDSVDGDLGLGWEVDLGIRGESKALKRAEAVFRENPEIKQIFY